jgi:ribosome maturation factor RimP
MFAYEKLPGLPRDRIVEAIAPVLRAHGLVGVELVWRTDGQGRVLQVTLENAEATEGGAPAVAADAGTPPAAAAPPGTDAIRETEVLGESGDDPEADEGSPAVAATAPGQRLERGVTLEVCSKVSRDLSTALDVLELIDGNYRLEVGSPGLERRLYTLADYHRFSGRLAKLKLASAIEGQYVLLGKLSGVNAEDRVLIVVDGVEHAVTLENVRSGQLAIDWQELGFSPTPRQRAGRRPAAQGRK